MDSPDLSPNEPPGATTDNLFSTTATSAMHDLSSIIVPGGGDPAKSVSSSHDSEDSSGFEKVDATSDLLAEYSTNFANQMAQSVFSQLPTADQLMSGDLLGPFDDQLTDDAESSFEVLLASDIQTLDRNPADIDEPRSMDMSSSSPHDDVLEKSYGDDLLGGLTQNLPPAAQEAAKKVDVLAPTDAAWEAPKEESVPEKPKDLLGLGDTAEQVKKDLDDFLGAEVPISPRKEEKKDDEFLSSPGADSGRDTVGKLIGEGSDDEEKPAFGRQTPEETTFERQGPLTIPTHIAEHPEEPEDVEIPHSFPAHHGFEREPRPPTPPKDISEEDVKPSTVHLGHSSDTPRHDPTRGILKNAHPERAGRCCYFNLNNINPQLLDLIYWRDPKKSGIALSGTLLVLYILTHFPIISVISYTALLALGGTLGFRVLKLVEAQIKKTEGGNPFQPYLEQPLELPADKVREQVDVLIEHGQCLAKQLRRLFLVENIVDSVKFGALLWSLTYVGAWFSGTTLIFLIVIGIFSIPKLYETYQEPIDAQLEVLSQHINTVTQIAEEKLPFLKRVEAEKKEQ